MQNSAPALIRLRGVSKQFEGPSSDPVLLEVDLDVQKGEYLALLGRSGSGKSTLIQLIAGIDRPTAGSVEVDSIPIHTLSEAALSTWRGRQIGFVFQFFQLLPTLTVCENVILPMELAGIHRPAQRRERAHALLEELGLSPQAEKFPATLSGGEQQRVAIARALANDPPILLADEPTGNLDERRAQEIYETLAHLASGGRTIILVTHDRSERLGCSRVISISTLNKRVSP